jgi:hypothetical protein
MPQYRVTKYDPTLRDAAGAYTKQDWTAFGDIGRSFGGITLTKEHYLQVESSYIEAAMSFLAEDSCSGLRAVGVENRREKANAPREGGIITKKDLPEVCRSILREEFWCKLEADGHFLHFGYDYYLYVGVKSQCDRSVAAARAAGLFVEKFSSPYLEADQE